ncbi:MAG: type II toxin-antitoxin system HicB family antitoxin [Proteobacteria bacterium]|nr:type II toxin-antitoxin system HicB family antitoxin [Pseudomonadota bacterium]MCL2307609.1 type II toxin-antitoxin system HicB family antitoxin [Pseudomonadota bacterium]
MKRTLKCVVFEEDGACVARCLDVEVASEGDTEEEAIANLREALELYFDSII